MKNHILQTQLKNLLGERCSFSETVRSNYARGEDVFEPVLSQAVVFPETNEEISSIVKICNKENTPIVCFGSGTSLEGNALGNKDGITLSLFINLKMIYFSLHIQGLMIILLNCWFNY